MICFFKSFVSKKWISSNAIEDEFDIICIIGEGTFGIVRIIQSKDTRTVFALKEVRKAAVLQLKQLDHIKNEKEILIELSNEEEDADFIVKLFRTMEDRKSLYFQFEYLPGGELFTHLHRAGKFPNDVRILVLLIYFSMWIPVWEPLTTLVHVPIIF